MYRLADIAFPNNSLASDLRAINARAVGLYVINHSVPGSVVSAAFAQNIISQGLGVLPIVTPGNTPSAGEDIVSALKAWGANDCPVAFDIETFTEPSSGWLDDEIGKLETAGYFPGMYGPLVDQQRYAGDPFKWRWLADWTFVEEILPPYVAMQWTDRIVGPSGTRYDLSDVQDNLIMWGMKEIAMTDQDKRDIATAFCMLLWAAFGGADNPPVYWPPDVSRYTDQASRNGIASAVQLFFQDMDKFSGRDYHLVSNAALQVALAALPQNSGGSVSATQVQADLKVALQKAVDSL